VPFNFDVCEYLLSKVRETITIMEKKEDRNQGHRKRPITLYLLEGHDVDTHVVLLLENSKYVIETKV